MSAKFHLFQELTNLFTAVIVLEITNQMIQEMTEVHVMTEVQDHHMVENPVGTILEQKNHEVINS